MTSAQLAALKVELQTDPTSLGYNAHIAAGNLGPVADLLNEVRPTILVNQRSVPVEDFLEALDPTELAALTQVQHLRLILITQQPLVPVRGTQIRTIMRDIFPSGGPTRTNLVALRTRPGSRAEELFGAGTVVTFVDCATALNS